MPGVIPAATVRTDTGGTRRVRAIDLEPLDRSALTASRRSSAVDDNEGVVDTDADAAAPAAPDPVDGEAPATADGFAALELDDRLLSAIAALGYEEPTPIQREAIPPLLAGRDLLAEAPTGTGKTAAFALPTLQRIPIGQAADGSTSALVLVPTRELAMQVAEALHQVRPRPRRARPAGLRRPADRPAAARPAPRRRRRRRHARPRGRPSQARQPPLRRGQRGHPRRGRRDARHGLRRRPRGDPVGDARRAPDGALLGDHLADHHAHRQAPPARPGADQGPCREAVGRRRRARPAGRLRRAPDRQARRAVPHPRCRGPDLGPRLRADARRGRRPGRGAERPRPRCGRPARRAVAGRPRPDDEPLPRRIARRPGGHRRGRPRARHRSTSRTS